jgi:hypothetical protein
VHPKVVAEMLGHSRIAVALDLNSHVTPAAQQQATEAGDAVPASQAAPRCCQNCRQPLVSE